MLALHMECVAMSVQRMTVEEVLSEARISRTRLYQKIRLNDGPRLVKDGRRTFFMRTEFEAWLQAQAEKPTASM
jgi:predicted DNA-binding transcriptional regulator AlpA